MLFIKKINVISTYFDEIVVVVVPVEASSIMRLFEIASTKEFFVFHL